ncbi:MAG: patatin-like phospholipase family protein [Kineosporiaceae bacterium]
MTVEKREADVTVEKKADLVLEGGGVKGIGLLGAVLTLADAGYTFPRVAGTSAGAIVASLVAAYQKAKKDLHELEDVMRRVDYTRFEDCSLLERLTGRVGEGAELLLHGGMHTGDYLTDWLGPELEKAGTTTFADLRLDDPGGSLARYQSYSLVVHASDLTRRVLVRLPWDYGQYGLDADAQTVASAVRASMSIPFYFRPVHQRTDRGTVTWVDGGMLSNFPITVFDRTDGRPPRWPTWGVKLSGVPAAAPDRPVRGVLGMAMTSLRTMTGDWNRYRLTEEGVNQRTINITTDGVSATDFRLDEASREALYRWGQEAARAFLTLQARDDAGVVPAQRGGAGR